MFKSHSNFLVRASGSIERMNGCEYKPAALGAITWRRFWKINRERWRPRRILIEAHGAARVRHYLATGKVGQPTCIP